MCSVCTSVVDGESETKEQKIEGRRQDSPRLKTKPHVVLLSLVCDVVREPVKSLIKPFSGGSTCALYVPVQQTPPTIYISFSCYDIGIW